MINKEDLVKYFEKGIKNNDDCKVGIEVEQLYFDLNNLTLLSYDKLKQVLEYFVSKGWRGHFERANIIGAELNGENISLEPAGQFEYSGKPYSDLFLVSDNLDNYGKILAEVVDAFNYKTVSLGYNPYMDVTKLPLVPKERYKIMNEYMPKVGSFGIDMMRGTCTVQANLDYTSEAKMIKMMRVGLALQPLVGALYANSPLRQGKFSGYYSYRNHVWSDVDNSRAGNLPFVFEDNFGFEKYVDYLLDVPMYFLIRDNKYLDYTGKSFRALMNGEYSQEATIYDWINHVSTVFPDVRLKNYIEVRGADSVPFEYAKALAAFWVGLFYSDTALDAAWEILKDFTPEERDDLRLRLSKEGMNAIFRNRDIFDYMQDILILSKSGLKQRGLGEEIFLDVLFDIVANRKTLADMILINMNIS